MLDSVLTYVLECGADVHQDELADGRTERREHARVGAKDCEDEDGVPSDMSSNARVRLRGRAGVSRVGSTQDNNGYKVDTRCRPREQVI